jgi:Cys-rich repeat protein
MPSVASTSYVVETWYEMVPSRACSVTETQSCTEDADCPAGEECNSTIPSAIALEADGRNIFATPEYVMGPSGRACGACHRSRFINQEEADALTSFNSHVQTNGTLVENDPDDEVLFGVIDKIMSMFE